MKKLILCLMIMLFVFATVYAQKELAFRKQRPEETEFLNKLHKTLFESLPHQYKDWTTAKEDSFDAIKYWCRDPVSWHDCTADIPKTVGIGDPYALDWQVDFTMPDSQSGPLLVSAIKSITDYTNAGQIASALKNSNKTKLSVSIYANTWVSGIGSFVLSYCSKTPPIAITLPVPTTLALKGLRSVECPIISSGSVSLSGEYYDNALIFIGKPVLDKKEETTSDGLSDTRYDIGFNRAKVGKLVVQNIVVKIKGDAADIDEVIKMIDWQKLYAVIDK